MVGHIFRSGAPALFLFAADEQRRDVAFARGFQKANAARPAKLVRRAAEKITFAEFLRGHFAEPLHGVGEERHLVLTANGQYLAPGLDDAGLVVRGHHADESRARVGQFRRQPVQVNHAVVRDGNEFRAFAKVMFGGFVDAGMFDGGNPDLGLRVERPREMVHDRVVRLGRAAGPDDVGGMAAEKRGEFFARLAQARHSRARRCDAGWTDCR